MFLTRKEDTTILWSFIFYFELYKVISIFPLLWPEFAIEVVQLWCLKSFMFRWFSFSASQTLTWSIFLELIKVDSISPYQFSVNKI